MKSPSKRTLEVKKSKLLFVFIAVSVMFSGAIVGLITYQAQHTTGVFAPSPIVKTAGVTGPGGDGDYIYWASNPGGTVYVGTSETWSVSLSADDETTSDIHYSASNGASGYATSYTVAPSSSTSIHVTFTLNDGDSDGDGGSITSNTVTWTTDITSVSPSASPNPGDAGQTIQFYANPTGGIGDTFSWNFGDGGTSTAENPTHSYSASGTYTVSVTGTDSNGVSKSGSFTMTVDPTPSASISENRTYVDVGVPVSFTASLSGGTGSYGSYSWTENGNQFSTAQNPSYSFSSADTTGASISFSAKDSAGDSFSSSNTLTLYIYSAPAVTLASSANPTTPGNQITFTASANGGYGSYNYAFYIGSTQEQSGSSNTYSTSYSTSGTYSVKVVVTDQGGGTASYILSESVGTAVTASANANPTTTDYGSAVGLSGNAAGGTPANAPQTIPSGITDYAPVTLTNSYSYTTTNPFEQLVVFDSSSYSSYEASNLQNVEWFTTSGAIIPSYIFSNQSNTATSTYYWLNVPLAISSGGSATVYAGFASTSTDFLSTTGNEQAGTNLPSNPISTIGYNYNGLSGNLVNGTYSNTGAALLDLNGSSSDREYVNYPSVTVSGSSTYYSGYFYPTTSGSDSSQYSRMIATSAADKSYMETALQGGNLYVNAAGSWKNTGYAMPNGELYHVVVYSTSSSFTVYVNGASVYTDSSITATSGNLQIGDTSVYGNSGNQFFGYVFDVQVSTSSLVSAQLGVSVGSVEPSTITYSYAWSASDPAANGGSFSSTTVQNPTYTIASSSSTSPETYTFSLTVTDNLGASSQPATTQVTVNPDPQVTVSASTTTADVGYQIYFTSSPSYGTSPYSFSWTYNGNQLSTSQDFYHAFNSAGSKTLTMTLTDGVGKTVSASVTVTINPDPTVSINSSQDPTDVGNSVTFSPNYQYGTGSVSYVWTINGGSETTSTTDSTSFQSTGTYEIKVVATDSDSITATAYFNETVNSDPSITINSSQNPTDVGNTVTFSSSESGGTAPFNYTWELNGVKVGYNSTYSTSFGSSGSQLVFLTITDSLGNTQTQSFTETVNADPSVTITSSQNPTDLGNSVTFTANPSGGSGSYSYQWYIGGTLVSGATSSSFQHTFSSTGTFNVSVQVTDGTGNQANSSLSEIVNADPAVSITSSQDPTDAGNQITFTAGVSGGTGTDSYAWTINDANQATTLNTLTTSFGSQGTYVVNVTATDANGNTAKASFNETVAADPTVSIYAVNSPTDANLRSEFEALASNGVGPFNYTWTMDGHTLYGKDVNYTFQSSGTYQIGLTIVDNVSQTASASYTETVNPSPSVRINSEYGNTVDVNVNDSLSASVNGGVPGYNYTWYVGGKAVNYSSSFGYAFSSTGTYTVEVQIVDKYGETNSSSLTINVEPRVGVNIYGPSSTDVNTQTVYEANATLSPGDKVVNTTWYLSGQKITTGLVDSGLFLELTVPDTGTYNLSVYVTDSGGSTNSTYLIITVNPLPTVTISPSYVTLDTGISDQLTSSESGGASPLSYRWSVDGNVVGTSPTLDYTFSSPGIFEVVLTVKDGAGNTASAYENITVESNPIVSISTSNGSIDSGVPDTLSASTTGGVGPFNYTWYVGPTVIGYGQSITYPFPSSDIGSALVTVQARDSDGIYGKGTYSVDVLATPQPKMIASEITADLNSTVSFYGSVSGGVAPYNYTWAINGTTISYGSYFQYSFLASGQYNVSFTVVDSFGLSSTTYRVITVNPSLSDFIDPAYTTIDPGLTDILSSDVTGGTSPYQYTWYIGGTAVSSAPSLNFSESSPGTYSVTLKVLDLYGKEASYTATITVAEPLSVSPTPAYPTVDTNVSDPISASVSGGTGPYTYSWNIGGQVVSSSQSFQYSFTTPGKYNVTLTVTDSLGESQTQTFTITVRGNPAVEIVSTSNKTDVGVATNFKASINGGTGPYTYEWIINGQTYNSSTETHSFSNTGNYTIQLTVVDAFGKDSATSLVVEVFTAPKVNVTFLNTAEVSQPFNVKATVSGGLAPYKYQWFFPNEQISGANASYIFSTAGKQSFSIEVSDSSGFEKVYNYTVEVQLYVEVAANESSGFGPLAVQFYSSVIGGSSYSYNWTFGNGNSSILPYPTQTFQAGNYSVELTATSQSGATGSANISITSLPQPVQLEYSPTANVTTVTAVNFKAIPNWDAGSTYSMNWLFPNGQTLDGLSANYTFPTYNPINTVKGTFIYGTHTITEDLTVDMVPNPITLKWNVPNILETGRIVNVSAVASSTDAAQYTYQWSIGGQIFYGADQVLLFNNPGNYTVSVTATSSLGNSKTLTETLQVENAGTSSSIVVEVTQVHSGPITTYEVHVVSPYHIVEVNAYLENQYFNLTHTNNTNGAWYNLTLNQGQYDVGTYAINIIAYGSNGQSNSIPVNFTVSSQYGVHQATIYSYFGGFTNFLIFVFVVIVAVGLLIMIALWHKNRNTEYVNLGGNVEVRGIKTPKFRRMRKLKEESEMKSDLGLGNRGGPGGFGGGGLP